MSAGLAQFFGTTRLLRYFSSASVTFTAATKTIAATNIHVGFLVGDTFVVASTVSNNGTFTIATLGTDTMNVLETVVNETPGACVINQEVSSGWMRADFYSRIVGAWSLSNTANLYVDWSPDRSTTIVTQTNAITGGTPAAYAQECVAPWVRLRLRNSGTIQTVCNCQIYAKGEI